MDHKEIELWSHTLDESEQAVMDDDLPESVPGSTHTADNRKWLRVLLISGNTGGRWAYWAPHTVKSQIKDRPIPGKGPHPQFHAIADAIFNGDAAHFIGMLSTPYVRLPNRHTLAWVLIDPKVDGPKTIHVREEPAKERYERSKEVYDVETKQTKRLP